jgi:hypothetical protein
MERSGRDLERVFWKDKALIVYDFLVIAAGANVHPEQTDGLKNGRKDAEAGRPASTGIH